MAFNWEKFIDLADMLVENKNEESSRSAISRAYYAAFNMSEAFAKTFFNKSLIEQEEGSIHDKVIKTLGSTESSSVKKASRKLRRLWGNRINSDYRVDATIDEDIVGISIITAREIIETIKDYRP